MYVYEAADLLRELTQVLNPVFIAEGRCAREQSRAVVKKTCKLNKKSCEDTLPVGIVS